MGRRDDQLQLNHEPSLRQRLGSVFRHYGARSADGSVCGAYMAGTPHAIAATETSSAATGCRFLDSRH